MEYLLKKLNYKGQDRICIVNSNNGFVEKIQKLKPRVKVDQEIDPKYLYEFCLIFVKHESDLKETVPQSIHNLAEDGVLWFAYPRENSKNYDSEISRNEGWDLVNLHGFKPVRQVIIDEDWNALRFRNAKYIKRKNQ